MTSLGKQSCLVLLCSFVFLCLQSNSTFAGAEEDVIKARVMELCLAKKDGKWGDVYDMLDSAYRKNTEKNVFIQKRRGTVFGDCEIKEVTIAEDGNTAKVKMTTDAMIQGSNFPNALTIQNWIKEGGTWFNQAKGMRSLFAPSH